MGGVGREWSGERAGSQPTSACALAAETPAPSAASPPSLTPTQRPLTHAPTHPPPPRHPLTHPITPNSPPLPCLQVVAPSASSSSWRGSHSGTTPVVGGVWRDVCEGVCGEWGGGWDGGGASAPKCRRSAHPANTRAHPTHSPPSPSTHAFQPSLCLRCSSTSCTSTRVRLGGGGEGAGGRGKREVLFLGGGARVRTCGVVPPPPTPPRTRPTRCPTHPPTPLARRQGRVALCVERDPRDPAGYPAARLDRLCNRTGHVSRHRLAPALAALEGGQALRGDDSGAGGGLPLILRCTGPSKGGRGGWMGGPGGWVGGRVLGGWVRGQAGGRVRVAACVCVARAQRGVGVPHRLPLSRVRPSPSPRTRRHAPTSPSPPPHRHTHTPPPPPPACLPQGSGVISVVVFGLWGNYTSKWGMLASSEESGAFEAGE